jgi:hypothetical protein
MGEGGIGKIRCPQFIKTHLAVFPAAAAAGIPKPGVRDILRLMFATGGYDSAYEQRQRSRGHAAAIGT